MPPFTSRIVVHRLAAGSSTFMAEKINTMTRGDSAGIGAIRVDSRATVANEQGARSQVESHFTFDGRTLALLGLRVTQGSGELTVTTRGCLPVRRLGDSRGAGGPSVVPGTSSVLHTPFTRIHATLKAWNRGPWATAPPRAPPALTSG
jgi:hypothetical protein